MSWLDSISLIRFPASSAIADEPTSALDVVVQRRVMQTLRRVQRDLGASVILIGHDMGLMAQFAERVGVMRAGKLVETGNVKAIFAAPKHPYTRMLMESLPSLDRKVVFQSRALELAKSTPSSELDVPGPPRPGLKEAGS